MRSGEDDNINNGADSLLNQLHTAIVGISMVISVLGKLTVETPDRLGTMRTVCLSDVDVRQLLRRVFLLIILDIKLVLARRTKRQKNKPHMFSRSGSRDDVDSNQANQAKIKRRGNTKEKNRVKGEPASSGWPDGLQSLAGVHLLTAAVVSALYLKVAP